MTSTVQLLTLGDFYTGYVTKIKNAVSNRPYNGAITYVHRVFIQFDLFPDMEIECSYMNKNKDGGSYTEGEYVSVVAKNFSYNNYGIQKDLTFSPSDSEKQTMEAAEFNDLKSDTTPGVDTIPAVDTMARMMHSAIMGSATFWQYRMDCKLSDFYNMVDTLMEKQLKFKEPQK